PPGGRGRSAGPQVAAAFSADGSATVAWAKPGNTYENGGTLEVFPRPAGGTFGAPQTLAQGAEGIAAAGGPTASAAIAWMTVTGKNPHSVDPSKPHQGGRAVGAATTICSPAQHA